MAQSTTKQTWYAIALPTSDEADVFIYDVIGAWGISADSFVKEMRDIKASTINVHLNSPGGEVFEGFAIYNALKATKANVVCYVDGIAASIASVVAMAGDKVCMAKNSFLMIHNPSTLALGDAVELRKQADILDSLATKVADVYAEKTGATSSAMQVKMQNETWYTAQEAIDAGLADEISDDAPADAPVASIDTAKLVRNSKAVADAIASCLNQRSPAVVTDGREIPNHPVRTKPFTEKSRMNSEDFKNFYAANPEDANVKAILATGQKAGKAEGRSEAISTLTAIVAACPGREKLAIDYFVKGHDPETVKAIVASLDAEATAASTALAAANAEIARLKTIEPATKAVSRLPALDDKPADVTAAIAACEKIQDPEARATAEWKADASLADQFAGATLYVAYRKAQLNGQIPGRGKR